MTLRRAGHGGLRARLRGEAALDETIDQGEHRAKRVARRADPVRAHERRIETGDISFDDAMGDAGGEEMECGAAVRDLSSGLVRR